jgi:NAD(P)-dependent dehydrogenase (short-subunit alcohol dehydrogenase family)
LRSRGWQVVGLDLKPASEDIIACDITDDDAVPKAVAEAVERLGGGLDVLINNAGIGGPASAGEPPSDLVKQMIEVNLLGAWRVTAAAIDHLVASRGRVVLLGSRQAFIGLPLGAAYGMSKRALTAYADALRAEYATHISVTVIHPAFVPTAIHDSTRAAGLKLEGFSTQEPLEGVVAKIVKACEGDKPGRDVPITRAGALHMAIARHFPKLVDRIVAKRVAKGIAAGDLDDAAIAAPIRARHGRA